MRPSLYEFAGATWPPRPGHGHHERCLKDQVLNHPFSHPGQHPQHVERLAAYWAEVMGCPPRYTHEYGGDQSGVLYIHSSTGAKDDLGRRFLDCFLAAADGSWAFPRTPSSALPWAPTWNGRSQRS